MADVSMALTQRIRHFFSEELWRPATPPSGITAWFRSTLQLCIAIGEGFVRDQLMLRSMALTYTVVLSLVPLIALVVSVLDAVGVSENVASFIVKRLAAGSPEAVEKIMGVVRDFKFGTLGTIGAASLIATSVLAIGQAERAFNHIWGVTKQRSWMRRFPDYLAVLIIAPILLAVGLSLSTTLQSQFLVGELMTNELFVGLYNTGLRFMPVGVLITAFGFLYWFLPNTQVRPFSAFLGGGVAALLFLLAQRAYLGLSVGAAKYSAIFGGVAFLPLLMVWVYLECAILLLGAEVAFAYQNMVRYRREVREGKAGPAVLETVGLTIVLSLARAFRDGAAPYRPETLSESLDIPVRTIRQAIAQLDAAGLVRECGGQQLGAYQLGQAAEKVGVDDVLRAVRGDRDAPIHDDEASRIAHAYLDELDRAEIAAAKGRTLADLLNEISAR